MDTGRLGSTDDRGNVDAPIAAGQRTERRRAGCLHARHAADALDECFPDEGSPRVIRLHGRRHAGPVGFGSVASMRIVSTPSGLKPASRRLRLCSVRTKRAAPPRSTRENAT